MSDDDQLVEDIPVVLLPGDLFSQIIVASRIGYGKIDTTDDGEGDKALSSYQFLSDIAKDNDKYANYLRAAAATAGAAGADYALVAIACPPAAPITALALLCALPWAGGQRCATIVIANSTGANMKKSGVHVDCGVLAGRPSYSSVNATTGSVISTNPDVIPGFTDDMLPGLFQGGVGMYKFKKNLDLGLGFYGTGGAISFTFEDPKISTQMAVSWLVPEHGHLGFAVTSDLSDYSSLSDFYEKTAGARKINRLSIDKSNSAIRIRGAANFREFPDKMNGDDIVFTVSIDS